MSLRAPVVRTGHTGIELREHAVRILTIDPHVAIVMGFEHVRFVGVGARIILHRVVRHAVERGRRGMARRVPGGREHQALFYLQPSVGESVAPQRKDPAKLSTTVVNEQRL